MEIAIAAYQACHFIGMPECSVHLTEAVIYMALAPKSNAMEVAYFAARDDAQEHMAEPVPHEHQKCSDISDERPRVWQGV